MSAFYTYSDAYVAPGVAAGRGLKPLGNTVHAVPLDAPLRGGQQADAGVTYDLPDYGLLHFATHDFVVPWSALNSGLVLAREPDGSPEDGLLSARTILGLPLSARLAVLSGSETGQEQLEGGEGLTVLAWAFQAAGCPALVASQWEVNAETTRAWMVRFYSELKLGRSKDEALQAGMLAVKRDHAAPYYWSAFELIGDTSVLPK